MNTYHDLAEAMRKGAALRPQFWDGNYFASYGYGIASCALGAAYEAATGEINSNISLDDLVQLFPALEAGPNVRHPVNDTTDDLFLIILSLNDGYAWTREAIADWLDTL